jgi:hypothetical protein
LRLVFFYLSGSNNHTIIEAKNLTKRKEIKTMEKQRKIILEPNGYYGGFRTTYDNKIMIDIKTVEVGIREDENELHCATAETTFKDGKEAFSYIFDNDLYVETVTAYEDNDGGRLFIGCFKKTKEIK